MKSIQKNYAKDEKKNVECFDSKPGYLYMNCFLFCYFFLDNYSSSSHDSIKIERLYALNRTAFTTGFSIIMCDYYDYTNACQLLITGINIHYFVQFLFCIMMIVFFNDKNEKWTICLSIAFGSFIIYRNPLKYFIQNNGKIRNHVSVRRPDVQI